MTDSPAGHAGRWGAIMDEIPARPVPGPVPADRPSGVVLPRDGFIAVAYFVVYMGYLFLAPESEPMHWVTMVVLPLAIAFVALSGRRTVGRALASVGLRSDNVFRGVGWAVLLGLVVGLVQTFWSASADAIQQLVVSGRALAIFPLTFVLMLATAAFTEELLFRGFIQTRLERLFRGPWLAVAATSLLFGLYHLPYAYLNPRWPSYGDWGEAWAAALGNGVPGGLLLGALYVVSRGNVVACIVLHALINAAPAMTMIQFGAG